MGKLYPLPPVRRFEEHSFHELGVLLDHMLHAHDLHEDMGRKITEYFGEYLSAASFFREDRAEGWGEPTVARDEYPAALQSSSTPLVYVENKMHALLRQLPKKFWDIIDSGSEEVVIGDIKKKLMLYRGAVLRSLKMDIEAPEHAERVAHIAPQWAMGEELVKLRSLLSPEKMPVCTFTINDQQYTVSNAEPLVADRPDSYPVLAMYVCATSGVAMIDRVKISKQYRDFLTTVVGNEADITLTVQRFMERAMRENPSLQASDFPQFDYEKARPALEEGKDMLALLYHTHAIAGKAKPDSLEAIRRFYAFASGESPDKPIPIKITSKEEVCVLLEALYNRQPRADLNHMKIDIQNGIAVDLHSLNRIFSIKNLRAYGEAVCSFLKAEKASARGH